VWLDFPAKFREAELDSTLHPWLSDWWDYVKKPRPLIIRGRKGSTLNTAHLVKFNLGG